MAEAFPWNTAPTYLVRDNDRAYGQAFQRRIRAMGIRDRPISPRSPWQNPYAERLIGTLRRECLDHVLIVGARRRMLASYSSYYNESRTLGVGEGCAVTASYPEVRSDHHHANSFRTAPSLCADMIFGKDRSLVQREKTRAPNFAGSNFITNIAESNFRYTQVKLSRFRRLGLSNCSHGRIYSASISLSLVLISGLSRKTMFNKELWTSSFPLYSMKPNLRNLFMKKLTRDRVVPIISASVS
jgi:hypothetical protein